MFSYKFMNTRFLPVLLGSALALNMISTPSTYAFIDIRSGSQLETYVNDLSAKGIISGYPDGSFRPEQTINRAEALKIIFETIGISADADSNSGFPDVSKTEWYAKYVTKAKQNNIVGGYPDGRFRPGQEVNRAEFVKMALSALPNFSELPLRKDPALQQFTDLDAGQWYVPYLGTTVAMELVALTEKFRPTAPMSRQDAVEIIYRVSKYLENPFVPEIAADASSSSTTPATFSSPEEAALSEEGAFVMDPLEVNDPNLPLSRRDLPEDQLKVIHRPGRTEIYAYLNGYNIDIPTEVETNANQSAPEELHLDRNSDGCSAFLYASEIEQGQTQQSILEGKKRDAIPDGEYYSIPPENVKQNEFEAIQLPSGVTAFQHLTKYFIEGFGDAGSDQNYYIFSKNKYYHFYIAGEENPSRCSSFSKQILDGFSLR
jgi:hypothetical protein